MADDYVEIPGSFRPAPPNATLIGDVADGERIEISVYLIEREADPLANAKPLTAAAAADRAAFKTHEAVGSERAVLHANDVKAVTEFARNAGLSVEKNEPARRLLKLVGTAAALQAAFRTKLQYYSDGGMPFRARQGSLYAPASLVEVITAVLGFDTRDIADTKLSRPIDPHALAGGPPNQIARLYGAPTTPQSGGGQCIALIELGGGFRDSDNVLAFQAMHLPLPTVVPISVSGGHNEPGVDPDADSEVALDIQVAGAVAPGARIAVYFAPNTTQGFVDAITRAVHDARNRPSVISISWGSAEARWTDQSRRAMEAALRDAARLGVTVFAASGDNLATDSVVDGRAHVDYPASSAYVVGCGGTRLEASGVAISNERVWNENGGGTGGGVSDVFALPPYQTGAGIPKSVNNGHIGRGVPDVAGDAAPSSGYRIVVAGNAGLIGGTSAVAPLWAGLFALINEVCGQPAGMPHPLFYGNPGVFRDIVDGNNKDGGIGYSAGNGWDACTGLGSPDGAKLLQLFRTASGQQPSATV